MYLITIVKSVLEVVNERFPELSNETVWQSFEEGIKIVESEFQIYLGTFQTLSFH